MPRAIRSAKLDSRTARARLARRREPYWVRIAKSAYLGYRSGADAGTWIARWQERDGTKRYRSLGRADDRLSADGVRVLTFDQAQVHARAWFARAARQLTGTDGEGLTVGAAIEDHLEYLQLEKAASTAYDSRKRAEKRILPALGRHKVEQLTTPILRRWRDSMVPEAAEGEHKRRAQDSANRVLTILKAALNAAFRDGRVSSDDAWRRLKPFRDVGEARKVFLSEAESQRLINACRYAASRDLVAGALLTGARLGELTAAKASDVDLDEGIWSVREGKTGRRDVVLTARARALFERLSAGRTKSAPLFLRPDGKAWGKGLHQRPIAAAVERAGLDPATTFYSLRHTHISHALKAGVNVQLLAENTGTSVRMIEKHYGKFLRTDRRRLLEAGEPALAAGDAGATIMRLTG